PAYNFHIFHLVNRNQRRISRIRLHTHSPRRPQQ
ncbi:glutamate decarboxylase isozyme, partial [Klebsiella pneumoniae]